MTTHTPGPWKIGNYGSVVTNTPDRQVEIVGPHSEDTINWYGGHVICETVTNGNAALIAAAPDLLEACKAARDWYAKYSKQGHTPGPVEQALIDAIAKAEAKP